jgi:hypothetical protein
MAGSEGHRFLYLYPGRDKRGKSHDQADVLGEHVNLQTIQHGAFVIRDEGDPVGACYRLFDRVATFWQWEATLPAARRQFHEVVFGQQAQRIKFDIDATREDFDRIPSAKLEPWFRAEETSAAWDTGANLNAEMMSLLGMAASPVTQVAPPVAAIAAEQKAEAFLRYLIDLAADVFEARYGCAAQSPRSLGCTALAPEHFIVTSSLSPSAAREPAGNDKFSYHLLVAPFLVANHQEAKAFTACVLDELRAEAPEFVQLVDPNVNKSTQNFRLTGSTKPGGFRPKIFSAELAGRLGTCKDAEIPVLTMVTYAPGAVRLPTLLSGAPVPQQMIEALTNEDTAGILAAIHQFCPEARTDHRFRRRVGTLLLFERERPSVCSLCCRVHDNENSFLVSCAPCAPDAESSGTASKVALFEKCRRSTGKTRFLGYVMCSSGAFPAEAAQATRGTAAKVQAVQAQSRLERTVVALQNRSRDPHASCDRLFETLPPDRRTIYNEPVMRPFEDMPTLAVKSDVGMGKTKKLREYLDTWVPVGGGDGLIPPPVIRFVTFRQTFSESLRSRFPEFKHYGDIGVSQITGARVPRLVIQVESLHRLLSDAMAGAPVGLVILDEVESVLEQFNSGLHKSFHESFTVFQWLLASAERVVCMDANLSDRTFRTLQRMRPNTPVHFHWNVYARARHDTVHITANKGVWLTTLMEAMACGKRIVVVSNSLREAKEIRESLTADFPQKKIELYSSETPQSKKALHFADVEKYWASVDVLMYTPTVSAGVSFEALHFDCMFVNLSDRSCNVETARQMMGRVRQLRDKDYFVCIRALGGAHPTDIATLERLVYDRKRLLMESQGSASAFPKGERPSAHVFDPTSGQVRPYRSPYFYLWLETARINNLSRNGYAERFLDQVADSGATVRLLVREEEADVKNIARKFSEVRKSIQAEESAAVAASPDLGLEEVADIRRRMEVGNSKAADVTQADRFALQKFQLRKSYNWEYEIDAAFVRALNPSNVQQWFANWQAIAGDVSLADGLERLREAELGIQMAIEAALGAPGVANHEGRAAGSLIDRLEQSAIRRRGHYVRHFFVIWMLHVCGFRCLLDPRAVPERWLMVRLHTARQVLVRWLTNILEEYEIRHPGYRKFNSEDTKECGTAILKVVNASLRKMYGVELRRAGEQGTDSGFFTITRLKPAKAFNVVRPGPEMPMWADGSTGAKPAVKCQLVPVDCSQDEVVYFVEWAYYEYDDLAQRAY